MSWMRMSRPPIINNSSRMLLHQRVMRRLKPLHRWTASSRIKKRMRRTKMTRRYVAPSQLRFTRRELWPRRVLPSAIYFDTSTAPFSVVLICYILRITVRKSLPTITSVCAIERETETLETIVGHRKCLKNVALHSLEMREWFIGNRALFESLCIHFRSFFGTRSATAVFVHISPALYASSARASAAMGAQVLQTAVLLCSPH